METTDFHVGVTGTRNGMNDYQRKTVEHILKFLLKTPKKKFFFHHGDCVGVDTEACDIAHNLGYDVICHPPNKEDLRAFNKNYKEIKPQYSYFKRNRDIVDSCNLLLVVPLQEERQTSGGTWYTHDYAIKNAKKVIVITPSNTNYVKTA